MLLLAFLFAVWCMSVVAAAARKGIEDARRGIPEDLWRGVSPLPTIPVVPLAFWGLAWLGDRVAAPWGTRVVGVGHAAFGVVLVASLVRDIGTVRSLRSDLDAPRDPR